MHFINVFFKTFIDNIVLLKSNSTRQKRGCVTHAFHVFRSQRHPAHPTLYSASAASCAGQPPCASGRNGLVHAATRSVVDMPPSLPPGVPASAPSAAYRDIHVIYTRIVNMNIIPSNPKPNQTSPNTRHLYPSVSTNASKF